MFVAAGFSHTITFLVEVLSTVITQIFTGSAVAVMVVVPEAGHPLLSVTATVRLPKLRPTAVCVVCPPAVQRYEYGEVPPDGVAVAVPSLFPQVAPVLLTNVVRTAA